LKILIKAYAEHTHTIRMLMLSVHAQIVSVSSVYVYNM